MHSAARMPPVPSLLPRSVFREVLGWYGAGLALFLILQMTDALSTTVGRLLTYNASFGQAAGAFAGYLPTLLNRALVLAVPFAVLLAFSRMQKDSEIKAMFAAGVRPLSLVWPLVLPFAVVGALAFVNAGYVVPAGLDRWDNAWYKIYGMLPPQPTQEKYTYAEPGALYYAGRVRNDAGSTVAQLQGVMVQRGDETITAPSGTWDTTAKTWTLTGAWIVRPGQNPQAQTKPITVPEADTLAPPPPEAKKVSTPALRAQLAQENDRLTPTQRRDIQFQLASRLADPVTPIVFALAAGALGLLIRNRAAAFATVLVFIVSFYVIWTTVPQLARAGAIDPNLAAWIPNLVFLVVAVVLAWRLR